jgi:predicted glycoside hydrolase/deacetylase ChbG (UPF0249 family)
MVRQPAAAQAAAFARAHSNLSVGLHLDLGEWRYAHGRWEACYEVVPADDVEAVTAEARRQLAAFVTLVGRPPTHLDSHQHIHMHEPVRSVMTRLAREIGVVLRGASPTVRYCGAFYGQTTEGEPLNQAITVDALLGLIDRLSPGVTELGCHPGDAGDVASVYRTEREIECRTLRDPRVGAAISRRGIRLRGFQPGMHQP